MKALLVIDMQQEYMQKYDENLTLKVNEEISKASKNGDLIFYIKNMRNLRTGKTSYEFADELLVLSDYIFYKEKSSVFSNPDFARILKNNDILSIEVIGIDGNCCVANSAVDAKKLGYEVEIPCRFVGVQNKERFEKKKTLLKKNGVRIIEA